MGQLVALAIRPGLYTDETDAGAEPFWHDGDRVRFRNGLAEQIGGWQALRGIDAAPLVVQGAARAIHDWSSLDSQSWIAIGTHLKLYLLNAGILYDITPLRDSGRLTGPFTVAQGATTVTVADTSHGVGQGDFVHFTPVDDNGPIQGEFRVSRVIDSERYEIELAAPAVTALAGGTARVDYEYEIPIGNASREKLYGFGVGPYGAGSYGTPRAESTLFESLRTWSLDNWGEDLMASPIDGPVYIWDRSLGPSQRARVIEAAPITNAWISVSPEDRHLVCFGAHTGTSPDPMLIRWSDQENYNEFAPTETNTAGDKRLDAGSRIVSTIDTRGERLIFTDEALYAMQFIGGNLVFGFSPLGRSVTLIGPNAAAQVNGMVYFMGPDDFFVYDGVLRTMACPVRNRVFDDLDSFQGAKAYAAVNRLFTEIIWVYPSADAADNDRYVIYNYREQSWYFGTLARTAMHDQSSAYSRPYGIDPDGALYQHETGVTADGQAMDSFLQSYDIDLGDGQQFMHVSRLIPDFMRLEGTVNLSLNSRRYPQSAGAIDKGPYPVTRDTQKVSVRARNRQIAIRVAAVGVESDWRMGTWRAEVRAHGQR